MKCRKNKLHTFYFLLKHKLWTYANSLQRDRRWGCQLMIMRIFHNSQNWKMRKRLHMCRNKHTHTEERMENTIKCAHTLHQAIFLLGILICKSSRVWVIQAVTILIIFRTSQSTPMQHFWSNRNAGKSKRNSDGWFWGAEKTPMVTRPLLWRKLICRCNFKAFSILDALLDNIHWCHLHEVKTPEDIFFASFVDWRSWKVESSAVFYWRSRVNVF